MPGSVIIATPSYITKKGLTSILDEMMEADILFIESLHEINQFLDQNNVFAVLIDEHILADHSEREVFFQLKGNCKYIALSDDPKYLPKSSKFDGKLNKQSAKNEVISLLEGKLQKENNSHTQKESLLSEREIEVLKLVALGYTNQGIADTLFISKHTVISHRKNITSKLGIKTVSGLTVYAVLNNLIPKDQIQ